MLIAPNNNYKSPTNSNGNMAFGVLNNAYTESWTDYMILESTQIYIFCSNAGGAVVCYGWVDNL
jgi:hypothetical protein